jgi:hypothetical protein
MRSYQINLKIILATLLTLNTAPSFAIELGDGRISFEKSPQLVSLTSTFDGVRQWYAKYYLTLIIPPDAGEPLGKIRFQQTSGSENIRFNLEQTFAFMGTKDSRGESIAVIADWVQDGNDYPTIRVSFPEGVPPSKTITIGFKPYRNPSYSGYYSFRVKAFPLGEKSLFLDLGVRSLYFWSPGRGY